MTLSKQMMLIVTFALFSMFVGTFLLTVYYSKIYFEEQLARNAQDTATALGLSLSHLSEKKMNNASMLSAVTAVFNRGYFQAITLRDTQDKMIISRFLKQQPNDVPDWFKTLVPIQNEEKSALIMHGWQQLGSATVQSDSSLAYMALWLTSQKLFILFLSLTFIISIISAILIKMLYKPLGRIIQQAEDIGKRQLYTLDKQPRLKELLLLSNAINTMVIKLQQVFAFQLEEAERLQAKAYQDMVTGLGNRRYFIQQFNHYLTTEDRFSPGYLFLIEIVGLAAFNHEQGYQQGDQVLIDVGRKLNELLVSQPLLIIARMGNPSFAIIVLEQDRILMEQLARQIAHELNKWLSTKPNLSCHVGGVKCIFATPASQLLATADRALQYAKNENIECFLEPEEALETPDSNKAWSDIILNAIKKKAFRFYIQPVKYQDHIYHTECFIKLIKQTKEIAASVFFPMVDAYAIGTRIDQWVFEEIAKLAIDQHRTPIAINLSTTTVVDPVQQASFLTLVRQMSVHTRLNLHFEVSEFILAKHLSSASVLLEALVKLGYTIGLDRVGISLTPLAHYQHLNLSYLKLDGSLLANLENNPLNQDIIRELIKMCKTMDIHLIATAVENKDQWDILTTLGIDYFQGNYIQSPVRVE